MLNEDNRLLNEYNKLSENKKPGNISSKDTRTNLEKSLPKDFWPRIPGLDGYIEGENLGEPGLNAGDGVLRHGKGYTGKDINDMALEQGSLYYSDPNTSISDKFKNAINAYFPNGKKPFKKGESNPFVPTLKENALINANLPKVIPVKNKPKVVNDRKYDSDGRLVPAIDKEFKDHVSLASLKGYSELNDGGDISSPNIHKDIVKPVETILKDFKGIQITSASRTKEYNASLENSVKDSDHVYGKALDLRLSKESKDFVKKINSDPKYKKSLGVRSAFKHGNHIHVSWN